MFTRCLLLGLALRLQGIQKARDRMTEKTKSELNRVETSDEPPPRRTGRPRTAPTRSVAARVPVVLAIAFHEEAKRLGRKRNDLIKALLEDFVRKRGEHRDPKKQVA